VIRIAFYSHDTFGLGHTSRVAKLANKIVKTFPESRCLIVTGLDSAGLIRLSPGIDFVRMPGVTKTGVEHYKARNFRMPTPAITHIRSSVLQAAVKSFDPHLFIVDNVPLGLNGEIKPLLEKFKSEKRQVPTVLLMRDVLDASQRIMRVWSQRGDYDALSRLYDRILILGDSRVYDPVRSYRLPESAAEKVRFCGLLGASTSKKKPLSKDKGLPSNGIPWIVVTVGGGEDGYPLIKNYLLGVQGCRFLQKFQHLMITGPYMPKPRKISLIKKYGSLPNIFIRDFISDIDSWLLTSVLVVSMGGYNTVYETLSVKTPLLVVPRVYPRKEQLIRAEGLAARGLLEMIHPKELEPEKLSQRIVEYLSSLPRSTNSFRLDFGGLEKAILEIEDLLPGTISRTKEKK